VKVTVYLAALAFLFSAQPTFAALSDAQIRQRISQCHYRC